MSQKYEADYEEDEGFFGFSPGLILSACVLGYFSSGLLAAPELYKKAIGATGLVASAIILNKGMNNPKKRKK